MTYTVTPRDLDGLTGIALRLKLCTKGPGNTRLDWADCLRVAQRIADANNIPDFNVISVGQVLTIPADLLPDVVVPVASGGGWGWLLAVGVAVGVAYTVSRS